MTVLILHGISGHAGVHWQGWLHDELKEKGYVVLMPELPGSEHPSRTEWLEKIKETAAGIPLQELIIVGHSLGVASALDFLEQIEGKVAGFISVSGFADDYGSDLNSYFMQEKTTDLKKVCEHVEKAFVIYGDDDPYVTRDALQGLADGLHITPMVIEKAGHINSETGYTTLPQVLDIINSI